MCGRLGTVSVRLATGLLNPRLYRSKICSFLALKIKIAPSQAPNDAKRWPKSGVLEVFESKTDLNRYGQPP